MTSKKKYLKEIFNARSIAIIGASGEVGSGKLSEKPLEYILKHGFKGRIYPVNPNYQSIRGLKCYSDIAAIPDPVEVALVILPAKQVPLTIKSCAEKGTKSVIICSSGFAESGKNGQELQQQIVKIASEYGMLLLGPNSDGLVKLEGGLVFGFQPILEEELIAGPIAIISQSGSVTSSLIKRFKNNNLGISYSIACGNEAMVGMEDYLAWVIEDSGVQIVCLFMETIRNPDIFYEAASKAQLFGKKIIVLKVGKSEEGKKAAAAHTGALVKGHDIYRAVFNKFGIIEAEDIDEMVEQVKLFVTQGTPASLNTAILSMSGGIGGLVADIATAAGLKLPQFSSEIQGEISNDLEFGIPMNPLDLTGQVVNQPEILEHAVSSIIKQNGHDIFIFVLGLLPGNAGLKMLKDYQKIMLKNAGKVFILFTPAGILNSVEMEFVKNSNIFVTSEITETIKALKKIANMNIRKSESNINYKKTNSPAKLSDISSGSLTEIEAKQLFKRYGIPIPKNRTANNLEEVKIAALDLGFPLVIKVNCKEISHKSDVGGVYVGLKDMVEVEEAYENIANKLATSVLIEEMIEYEQEIILGMRNHAPFGNMLLIGLGGLFVEILEDYQTALVPVNKEEILSMLENLKGSRLLKGFRGKNAVDLNELVNIIDKFQIMCQEIGERVQEVEINPLVVCKGGDTFKALDGVITLS